MPVTYVVGVVNCSTETFDMMSAGKASGRETKYEKIRKWTFPYGQKRLVLY